MEYQDYRDACNINDELLSPEERRSDYVPPNFGPGFDELVGIEPAATPPTPVVDGTQPESRNLPRPADKPTADCDSENETEKAEPRAEDDAPPSDTCEPESGTGDSEPPNTQQGSDSRASDDQLMPAVMAAGPGQADLADQQASGEVSLAAGPE